jgi:L-fuculose-phosphate aldolase
VSHAARRELLETAKKMSAVGLSKGTSGNVSVRLTRGFLITPSGLPYDAMTADDLVVVDERGVTRSDLRAPSSEWRLHRDLYAARPEVSGIVHAHPTFATVLASLRRPIPAVHYQIAVTGEAEVRCAPYATFGTEELSRVTLKTLGASRACLMANHGMVAAGGDLAQAFKVASEVEWVAEQYWRALQVGEPVILPAEEMERVIEKFARYGQAPVRRVTVAR